MVSHYRGHKIDVTREQSLGGRDMLYYTIMRDDDGYLCVDDFEESDEKVREKIVSLKSLIDGELQEDDPWEERISREDIESMGARQIDKPWNEITPEERKHMVALAKIGMLALVDEATTYQEERDPNELREIFENQVEKDI